MSSMTVEDTVIKVSLTDVARSVMLFKRLRSSCENCTRMVGPFSAEMLTKLVRLTDTASESAADCIVMPWISNEETLTVSEKNNNIVSASRSMENPSSVGEVVSGMYEATWAASFDETSSI